MTIEKEFEARHLRMMQSGYYGISRQLKVNAATIARKISTLQTKRYLAPDKYGSQLLRNKKLLEHISSQFFELEENLNGTLNGLTANQWGLANVKNTLLVKSFVDEVKQEYTKLNLDALKEFQKRSVNGLKLSDRIHNVTEINKQLYKDYIGSGITQGKSSVQIARDLNKININPRNVTVFDKQGNPVKLDKISKILQPNASGRGIYKSPLKNLYRVTRTETNAAYRISDNTRIQQLDFVIGYEVHTSASHNVDDMCDYLKGKYPKNFVFSGWHPACICYVTSILKTKEEFRNGVANSKNQVKRIPRTAQRYVKTKDMSKYDWHKDNFTTKNIPKKKVGGSSSGIEPYKKDVTTRNYTPKKNIVSNAAKRVS